MIRLMIVDDEKKTREGLARFISWKDMGISEVLTAEDGTYAYEICKNKPPHILLTDVRMPKMDGIRLAELVKAQYPDCMIIFLSGYSDKEYLLSAINLNVLSYIEKPVDQEEVKNIVTKAVEHIKCEMIKKTEDECLKSAILTTLPLMMQQTVINLINTGCEENVIKLGLSLLNTGIDSSQPFTSLAVRLFRHYSINEKDKEYDNLTLLNHLFEQSKVSRVKYIAGFLNPDHMVIHVQARLLANCRDSQEVINDLTLGIKKYTRDCASTAVGVGTPTVSIMYVKYSYEAADKALKKLFFTSRESINFSSAAEEVFNFDESSMRTFDEILSTKSRSAINAFISELTCKILRYTATDPEYIRNIYVNLLCRFNNQLGIAGKNAHDEESESISLWNTISNLYTASEIETFFHSYINQYYEVYEDGTTSLGKVTDIKRYVLQNYSNSELSIKQIAENMYLRHTYMCFIFKKSTGKTINSYITEIRLSKAKELLKDKNIKLYEVSEKVGYKNQNYFTKLFKDQIGYTPSKYRERLL